MIPTRYRRVDYFYVVTAKSIRTEIFINTGDSKRNSEIFAPLQNNRSQIDHNFGDRLVWRIGKTCGIKRVFAEGSYRNQEDWPIMISPALENLLKLAACLNPYLKA